ncbi:MAG: DUF1028 domain-containing protein [Rhodospirillaceae bacterium]|jgi:uncharacterized Ntn-hydrolase superfamily protein|nr:DUF1028 domain-containing protein [Rhodospirillaceae bacterium]MBT6118920.1 DUF1028 domain-containing protein [Rhodospirillaceae bacterium]
MTFSVSGRCRRTGQFGIAITTSSICVGARCVWVREGVGVIGTQNQTNPGLGKFGLDLLAKGAAPQAVMDAMIAEDGGNIAYRQLAVLNASDPPLAYSGTEVFENWGEAIGKDSVAIGNLLKTPDVAQAMVDAFEAAEGEHLVERLLRGLEGGLKAGGEHGDVHSAGVQVKDEYVWPICDLRVDWDEAPIARLRSIWADYQPQMGEYLTRALNPAGAQSYGVPGNQ